jgi:hypothetical protein
MSIFKKAKFQMMATIKTTWLFLVMLSLFAICNASFAQENAVESISADNQSGDVVIKFKLKNAIATAPTEFSIKQPAVIVIDFVDTSNQTGSLIPEIVVGAVWRVDIVSDGSKTKTRVAIRLTHPVTSSSRVAGDTYIVTIKNNADANTAEFAQENVIENVSIENQSGNAVVAVKLKNPISGVPTELNFQKPLAFVAEFSGTSNASGWKTKDVNIGAVKRIAVVPSGAKTGVVLSLVPGATTASRVVGDTYFLTVHGKPEAVTASPAAAVPVATPVTFTIHAKGINPRALAFQVASQSGLDIVMGDQLSDQRRDFDASSLSAMQVIARIVGDQHLATRRINNTVLVASACRLTEEPGVPKLARDQRTLSFYFQNIGAGPLVAQHGIIADELKLPVDSSAIDTLSMLSIGVRDNTAKDAITAIATVLGWTVQTFGEGGVQFAPNKNVAECESRLRANERPFAAVKASPTPKPLRLCPGTGPTRPRCEPMETYDTAEFKLLGYVQQGSVRMAIFEAVDGGVFWVQEGHFLGKNNGKITQISDTGVTIDERIQDSDGIWKDRPLTWNFP